MDNNFQDVKVPIGSGNNPPTASVDYGQVIPTTIVPVQTPVASSAVPPITTIQTPTAIPTQSTGIAAPPPKTPFNFRKLGKFGALGLLLLLLLVGGGLTIINVLRGGNDTAATVGNRFENTKIPLEGFVGDDDLPLLGTRSLVINGPLVANDAFTISPSGQPSNAARGQIYYDQTSDFLAYYNGTEFIPVGGDSVLTLQGQSGNVTLIAGSGIGITGTTINNAGVTSLGGQTGDIALGAGLNVSGGALTNSGIVSATAGTGISVVNDGNGNITISNSGAGTGTVNSPGGTPGRLAKFTGVQTIADSLLSETGTTVTVNGDLDVTGGLTLGTALSVGNGGTGSTSLTNNGVVIAHGAGALTAVAAGAPGECLLSTAGAPAWSACPGGGGGVTDLNGLAGSLTIANATTGGSTITINDASTSQKGIAQFNATNFNVVGGNVNTVQNINTTATPTFSGVNTNNITPSGSLTIGATSQPFTLQGSASSVVSATNGVNSTTLSFQTPGANVNYRFATATAGTYDVCTMVGNCAGVGGGVTTAGGTPGTLPVFNGSQSLADSLLSQSGGTVTVNGNLNLAVGNQYRINGSQISSANLSNDANLAKLNANQTFTGNNNFVNTADSPNAFSIQNAATQRILTADTSAGEIELGQGSTLNGRLVFNNSTNANTITIVPSAAGAPRTITLPDDSGTICLSTGNCAGAGATLQTAYNNSTSPEITLDGTRGALTIRDAVGPIGANLLEVQNNTGSTTYLAVTSSGISVTGTTTSTSNINSTTGGLQTGNTTRVDNSGNLTNIGNLTATAAITIASTGAGNDIILNSADTIELQDNTNVTGNMDVSGTLAVGTTNAFQVAANGDVSSTGNATLQGGSVAIGTSSQAGVLTLNDGSSNTGSLQLAALGQNTIYTLPDPGTATVSICLTTGNCAGSGGGVVGTGTNNRISKFTSTGSTIGDSTISDNGTNVTTSVDVIIQGGDLTVGTTSQLASLVLHDGNGQTTTLQGGDSAGDLTFILPTNTGSANQCLKQSGTGNQLVWQNCDGGSGGSSATLQTAYANGQSITTSDTRDIDIVLANTTTDSNFDLVVADGSTSFVSFTRANGAGTADPAQMLLIDNLDTDRAVPIGIKLQASAGGLTTAIDATDPEIVTAISVAANDIVGTTGNIDFTNFDVVGSSGNVTTAGDLTVQGGDITCGNATCNIGANATVHDTFLGSTTGGSTTLIQAGSGSVYITSSDKINLQVDTVVTGALNVSGIVTASSLGVANTSTYLCRNGSNQIATCNTTGAGAAFVQGGNLFGATGTLGTNDSNQLDFRTNSTTRLSLGASGGVTVAAGNALTVTSGLTTLNGATTGDALSVSNSTSTGNIALFKDNATTVATIADGGATTFQNSVDSANAFKVLNSGAGELAGIDTADSMLRFLANNTGHVNGTSGQFNTGSSLGAARCCSGAVALNGYLYNLGGADSGGTKTTTVSYARINSDGSVGSWTNTTSLPQALAGTAATVYNGYIYVHGGAAVAGDSRDVYYAKPNNDGTITSWTTQNDPTNLVDHVNNGMAAYNGFLYITGGEQNDTTLLRNVYYGRIGADGSVPTFTVLSNWLPASSHSPAATVITNGFLYVLGSSNWDKIYYGRIAADGSVAAQTQTTGLATLSRKYASLAIMNGYLYIIGGNTAGSNTLDYGQISSTGDIPSFTTDTTTLPAARTICPGTAPVVNNYIYLYGCGDGGFVATTSVYYASGSRVKVGGGLDLVGYSGEGLSDGGAGGQLTAGNTFVNGLLSVTGSTTLRDGLSVGNGLSIYTPVNTTSAFSIINAASTNLLNVDTSGNRITIGVADTTGVLLVLDTKTDSGDPTGTAGAMYYNSNSAAFRCFTTTWANCAGSGSSPTLQNAYDNSSSPANILTADGKDIRFQLADTTTDANFLVDLQCDTSCSTNGRFAIQNDGVDVLSVAPVTDTVTVTNTSTAGTGLTVLNSNASQTTTTLLNVAQTGTTTGYTGNLINFTSTTTTGSGSVLNVATNALNGTGSAVNINSSSTGAFTNGLLRVNGSAAHTGTVAIINSASTAGTGLSVTDSSAGQISTTLINAVSSGYTTGYTGNVVNFSSTSTTGASNVLNVTNNSINGTGTGVNINSSTAGALTNGLLRVNASAAHTGSVAVINSASTAGTGLSITDSSAGQISTTLLNIVSSGYTTGYTGNIVNISGTGTTGSGANVVNISNNGINGTGTILNVNSSSAGVLTNGLVRVNASAAHTGTAVQVITATASGSGMSIVGNSLTTGNGLTISSTNAMTTTGSLLNLSAATATTTTGLLTIGAAGLTSGYAANINVNGSNSLTSGGALNVVGPTGAAAISGGLVKIAAAGVYTGTAGLLNVAGNATTAGTLVNFSATSLTTGTGVLITGSTATTTGNSLSVVDGRVTFQLNNTTDAFRVLNSGGAGELMGVDTASNIVRLLGNNSGVLPNFTTNANSLTTGREGMGVASVNGYIYTLGGCDDVSDSASTTVQFAKVNSDGSTGVWSTTTQLPVNNCVPAATSYNGYIYVHGGSNTTAEDRDKIFYAKPKADGTITEWVTSGVAAPVTDIGGSSYVAYNGYLYELGLASRDIYRIAINADGSLSPSGWTLQSNWFPASNARKWVAPSVTNGYLYAVGGYNAGDKSTVYYGRINADGSVVNAAATSALPSPRGEGSVVVANGYMYFGGTDTTDLWYALINSDGTLGTWQTLSGVVPAGRTGIGMYSVNNSIIIVGGFSGSGGQTNVWYSNVPRVRVGGGLDLLTYSGENGLGGAPEGNSGGQLSAGNTLISGTLTVTDTATVRGNASVGGNFSVNGLAAIQTTTDTSAAFRLSSSKGYNILRAGTIGDSAQMVIDGSGEMGTDTGFGTRWTGGICGALQTFTRVNTQAYSGDRSFEVVSSTSSACGLTYSFTDGGQAPLAPSTTYTASAYVKLTSGTTGDMLVQYNNGVSDVDCNPTDATPITGAWKRIYCTFTTTAAVATESHVRFLNVTGNSVTWYIDDIQIVQATTVAPYFDGTLDLDAAVINSGVSIKPTENTTNALQVVNASNIPLFTVDTASSRVRVGGLIDDSTGALLVLDTKNTSGDPTGVNGGMYYNSNSKTFRCYENSVWYDCISRHKIVLAADVTDSAGNACTMTNITGLTFNVSSGVNYNFHANIIYTAAATGTGSKWSVVGPATPTLLSFTVHSGLTATTESIDYANANDGGTCTATSPSASTNGNTATIEGVIRPSANGTLDFRMGTEVDTSAIVAKAGSTIEWW